MGELCGGEGLQMEGQKDKITLPLSSISMVKFATSLAQSPAVYLLIHMGSVNLTRTAGGGGTKGRSACFELIDLARDN